MYRTVLFSKECSGKTSCRLSLVNLNQRLIKHIYHSQSLIILESLFKISVITPTTIAVNGFLEEVQFVGKSIASLTYLLNWKFEPGKLN